VPNVLFGFLLFLGSYAPALVIFAIRSYGQSCTMFVISVALTAVGVISTLVFVTFARRRGGYRVEVVSLEPRNSELAAYVATYLLPFVTVLEGSWQEVASLAVFLFFIGLLYVRSGMLYLNPLLALLGYSVAVGTVKPVGAPTNSDELVQQFMILRDPNTRIGDQVTVADITPRLIIERPHPHASA
jgi:hypothetical protein